MKKGKKSLRELAIAQTIWLLFFEIPLKCEIKTEPRKVIVKCLKKCAKKDIFLMFCSSFIILAVNSLVISISLKWRYVFYPKKAIDSEK